MGSLGREEWRGEDAERGTRATCWHGEEEEAAALDMVTAMKCPFTLLLSLDKSCCICSEHHIPCPPSCPLA